MEDHAGADNHLQPMQDPTVRQLQPVESRPGNSCGPWRKAMYFKATLFFFLLYKSQTRYLFLLHTPT